MIGLGRLPSLAAVVVAAATGLFTVATTTRFGPTTTQFVAFGVGIFVVAVVVGSRFAVGVGVLMGLAGATIEIATVAGQQWGRVLVIGCLWYVAAELAWDGMERRDGRNRSRDVDISRLREVSTILVLSTGATAVAVAAAGFAPNRTLLVLAAAAVVCSVILIVATRHLASLTGEDPAPDGPAESVATDSPRQSAAG